MAAVMRRRRLHLTALVLHHAAAGALFKLVIAVEVAVRLFPRRPRLSTESACDSRALAVVGF
jgi:hypothetical protein